MQIKAELVEHLEIHPSSSTAQNSALNPTLMQVFDEKAIKQ